MLFKQYRINKLKIKIAGLTAAASHSANFVTGDTNSHFTDRHEKNVSELAQAEMKLSILEAK